MKMRPSKVLAKLRAGEVVSCGKINLTDPRSVEIASATGYDCMWLCMEHVPNTLHDIENQIRAAKMYDVDTMVRVPRGSYSDLIRPLEMDATGLMVPHIMGLEDAKKVAWYTRFHPIGRRPYDGGNSDGHYCAIPIDEYIAQANEQRFIAVQIEDPEPLDELEEIAQVEGIDMLFFGPGDFSHSLGVPGQIKHPKVQETLRRVGDVARKHGKFAGCPGGLAPLKELTDMGYQFIGAGADVVALREHFLKTLSTVFGR